MFNLEEMRNTILDTTPICEDAVNIIMNMVKPTTFEVGKYYKSNFIKDYYKIEKKTKCFLYYSITNRKVDKPTDKDYLIKKKFMYDKEGNEYIYFGRGWHDEYKYNKIPNFPVIDKRGRFERYLYSKDNIELK